MNGFSRIALTPTPLPQGEGLLSYLLPQGEGLLSYLLPLGEGLLSYPLPLGEGLLSYPLPLGEGGRRPGEGTDRRPVGGNHTVSSPHFHQDSPMSDTGQAALGQA